MGRPLPREVVYYEVPPALVVKLPQPHPGQRYVRVATDILLISVGSGMVIDAINDLGRR
jgi:Ni/Co efflux regulator RcnB